MREVEVNDLVTIEVTFLIFPIGSRVVFEFVAENLSDLGKGEVFSNTVGEFPADISVSFLLGVEGNWVPNLFEEFFVVQHDLLQHILLNVHINLFVRNLEQLEDVVDVYVSDAGAEFQQLFLVVFLFEGDV